MRRYPVPTRLSVPLQEEWVTGFSTLGIESLDVRFVVYHDSDPLLLLLLLLL